MSKNYVEMRDGVYRVAGTRVSLDSIVYAFRQGQTAESTAQSFPSLTLEQVYGAIAFYLANQDEIDAYLSEAEKDYNAARGKSRRKDQPFYGKLRDARLKMRATMR